MFGNVYKRMFQFYLWYLDLTLVSWVNWVGQVMTPHHSDQMSLGSLCSVVKTLIVSLVGPTKGQGHLLSCSGQLKTITKTYRSE